MQFIKQARFQTVQEKAVKSTFMSPKQQRRIQKVRITCCKYSPDLQAIACGLTDGSILQFVNQKYNHDKLTASKDYEVRKFNTLPKIHKGQVKCILYERIFQQSLVITGSADRTIKIWQTEPKNKDVVQTMAEHGGSILCMAYSRKSDTLFSGSSDKTIRIWRQDEARKFSMHPWYQCYQMISDFSNKKIQMPLYPTSFDIHDGEMNNFTLYVGDSLGNLHVVKEIQLHHSDQGYGRTKTAFQIQQSNYSYHRLNINSIVYVPKQHLVFTCAYDQQIYGFQSLSDKLILKHSNPRKCLFTSLAWYKGMLVAADQQGMLYCIQINSDRGIDEIKKYNQRINQIIPIPELGQLLILGEDFVDVIKLVRGIKAVQGGNCHTDAIVGMFALQAYRITDKKVRDTPKIISVSLDNTMRVWDPIDLTCLQVLNNSQKSEICSLFYLKRANLFVTGHDNGAVRLWNIQLETFITISPKNSPHAHKNNVCTFAEYIHTRGNDDITEFMFSAGYEGNVNVWEIFIKKSSVQSTLMSSTICPELKHSFFPNQQQHNAEQLGYEIFCLQVWEPKDMEQQSNAVVISAGSKGEVYFTKIFTYQTLDRLKLHQQTINCMIIDQNILFTGSYDRTIKMLSLENKEQLNVLQLHNSEVNRLQMLCETGHLISHAADGEIIFWDYTRAQPVKKIREKKQTIICSCYFDELQMLYVGTQDAKMLSYGLKQLYDNSLHKDLLKDQSELSEQSLQKIMRQNEQELAMMLNDN